LVHEVLGGIQQSAVSRKPDRLARPEAVGIEVSEFAERIVSAAMRVAGKVIQLPQLPEHGDVDRCAESLLEFEKIRDLAAYEELADSAGRESGWSHNVIVPTESASSSEL
jgi:hypothetical protein